MAKIVCVANPSASRYDVVRVHKLRGQPMGPMAKGRLRQSHCGRSGNARPGPGTRSEIPGRCYLLLLGTLLVFGLDVRNTRANGNAVDLALVLAVDISRSVNLTEYRLQRGGLAYAIRHPDVIAAIMSGRLKRIAVTVVQWSGYESQVIVVPWTVVSDASSAIRFSSRVAKAVRFFGGHGTHVAGMIKFGARLLEDAPFIAHRKVIDISGDGRDNVTEAPGRHRDDAVAAGITINGLAIENEEKDLRLYYRAFIIGGPGAFVIRTRHYKDHGDAMKKKLIREISPKMLTTNQTQLDSG